MNRCNKCNRELTRGLCTFCPDPAQKLLALQQRVVFKARPGAAKAKRVTAGGAWWMKKLKQPMTEHSSGQDAALPVGDR